MSLPMLCSYMNPRMTVYMWFLFLILCMCFVCVYIYSYVSMYILHQHLHSCIIIEWVWLAWLCFCMVICRSLFLIKFLDALYVYLTLVQYCGYVYVYIYIVMFLWFCLFNGFMICLHASGFICICVVRPCPCIRLCMLWLTLVCLCVLCYQNGCICV